MPLRQPKRREAQVWLAQFNQHLLEWLQSSRSNEQHLREAFIALRSLLEREPEVADTVSNLCATLLHQHAPVIQPDLIDDLARLGLDAQQIRSDDHPLRWAERVILQLALARAANAQHRRYDALRAVRTIELPTHQGPSPMGCLNRYLGAKVDGELAVLSEAGLDRVQAEKHARAAVEACDWLIPSNENLAGLLRALMELFYGDARLPEQALKASMQAMAYDLYEIEIQNSVRMTRCAIVSDPEGASSAALAALVEQTVERITKRGVADLTAVDFIAFFRQAPERLCRTVFEKVASATEGVQVDRAPFDVLLPAAAAAYATCAPGARRKFLKSAGALEELADPVLRCVGAGLLVVADVRTEGGSYPPHGAAFLQALDGLICRNDEAMQDWRIRAELDDPIGVLIAAAASRITDDAGGENRIRLAQLLDGLRVAPSQALGWLALLSADDTPPLLEHARRHADDLFGRLVFALQSWPKTVAIVIQAVGDKILFVCATAAGVRVFEGGEEFRTAAFEAARCVAEQMDLIVDLQIPPDDAMVRRVGRATFDALPAGVRAIVSESDTVMVCPDYRVNADSIPFEILQCGDEWLGIAKVVTRLPSVEAMVRAAEGSRRRVLERRLLSIAITQAQGSNPPLAAAGDEAESVRASLASAGWDAPPIHESRVDPPFILNRTPFAAHMHIAAHGDVDGASDAVLLSHDTRLTPEDVIDGSYGCTPTVWLNTCVLGQSSYLGGGAVRGVAQAFVAAGAPAVIANLLPVDDQASSCLAERFYVHANMHDFGEALRRARRDLAGDGVSPVLWGSTVLMGDSRVTLQPNAIKPAAWQQALVQALRRRGDTQELAVLGDALDFESQHEPDDLRLACAAEIVRALRCANSESPQDDTMLLAEVCRLCLRIQAADAAATAAYAISELTQGADRPIALLITRGAIGLFRPVEAMNPDWSGLTNQLLIWAEQLRRGDRALSVNVRAPGGTDDAEFDETRRLGQSLMEMELAIDLRSAWYGLTPAPRPTETSAEDILWNAVMASQTKSFEDMPETIAYARHVAAKLAGSGALPPERVNFGATMLAGLLKWMWDGQNLVAVGKKMIESQARVAQLALASLLSNWSPDAAWMVPLLDFGTRIGEWLGALDELPYDEKLSAAIDSAVGRVHDDASARLKRIEEQFPDRVPDAITFLMGTLVESNTYSYTEGSVPEEICEKLKGVHHQLSIQAEGCLMPWLMEGFRGAREPELDELQRWCYGIGADATATA